MRLSKILITFALSLAFGYVGANAQHKAAIVPMPSEYITSAGSLQVPQTLTVSGKWADDAARYLNMRGHEASTVKSKSLIKANVNNSLQPESYQLQVSPKDITIEAADQAGLMYAIESLTQIIDQAADGKILACQINDSPRMQYRGMMLDVVRCYLPMDEVKKIVDIASQLKINKLHLHMTDDNGWRIEIKKYPKLTEVGAWRVDRPELFPGRSNPKEGEPTTYGGFYTQDELRDLVAFAAERNIEVIPEIEMPAHAIGAIASYPELACPIDEFVGVLTGIGGKAASIIVCAGKDSSIQFYKDVLDEVMDIFPSEHIHLGGDEANKSRWEKCELCNKRLKDENLNDFEELQGWFMDQLIGYVNSKGKKAIGWDEVTYGKPKEDITIMGWQGTGAVAEKYAAETGCRFIMTPAKYTYLIRYQGPQWFEPFTYFGNITLKDVYEFEPVKPTWKEGMKDQLWGMQGSMWTEFCRTPQDVQYMMFPRMLAIADVAWRPEGARDWEGFINAADHFLPRMTNRGMTYAPSMFNIQHTATPNGDGTVTLSAECIRPDAKILFSTNQDFSARKNYSSPLKISDDQRVKLVTETPGNPDGAPLLLDFGFNKATGRNVAADTCTNGLAKVLLNGIRGSQRNSDFEWAGWYDRQARFTIDLGKAQTVSSITLGTLANANMNVALPANIKVYLAGEDKNFELLTQENINQALRFPLNPEIVDFVFQTDKDNVRYVRFVADNGGRIPTGLPREDNATWLYFDEVIVK